jgi:hypothetical protein
MEQPCVKLAVFPAAYLAPASTHAVFAILPTITFSLALPALNAPFLSVSTAQTLQHAKPVTYPMTFISTPPPFSVKLVPSLDAPFAILSLHAKPAIQPPIIY